MSYVSMRQRRTQREMRQNIMRRVIDWVGQIILATIVGIFLSFIVINWLAGCGEQFPTDAHGNYVMGECIYPSDLWNDYRASNSAGSE